MSDEQVELENESQTKEVSQPGNAGRIFLTLLVLALTGVTVAFASLKDGKFFQELLTRDEWTSQLIGNLHPLLIMLPLGLVLMVVLLEIFGWLSFGKWKPATVGALFFLVLTAVLASLSGLVLMELEGNAGPDWTQYLWFGVGATAAFALGFICKIWGRDGNSRGLIYAVFLLGGTAALGYGGYVYGQKVHDYTLVPSQTDPTTPFGNQKKMAAMNASITEFEASAAKLEGGIALREAEIVELTSAREAIEESLLGEQEELAAAKVNIVELNKNVMDARKKTDEAEAKASEAEKMGADAQLKLQQELNDLKAQLDTLKVKDEAEQPESPAEEKQPGIE